MIKNTLDAKGIVRQLIVGDGHEQEVWGPQSTITYAVSDFVPTSSSAAQEAAGFVAMTPYMKQQVLLAFELWDDVIAKNLTATKSTDADITFSLSYRPMSGSQPAAYSVNGGQFDRGAYQEIHDSDIWMNPNFANGAARVDAGYNFGQYAFTTAVHEIGHSLGFTHPGKYNNDGNTVFTFSTHAEYSQDTEQYSIMSYFQAGADMNKNIHQGFSPQTPLLHDVMAIQAVYGADMTTRTGDTTYGFNATFGNSVWDFAFNTTPIVCIWDAAGNDTLNLGGYNFAQTIDLREGAFSSIMGLELNLSIAHGCKVENAVGGTSADTVIGNALGNVLYGGAGGDALYGLGGNDVLVGGVGADAFVFVNGGQGSNGWDLITDFGVGVDRVLLDDTFFGTSAATLTAQIKTQAQGWAYLEFSASDGVVFQGVTEAALEQALSGFAFV